MPKNRTEFASEVTGNARGIGTFWQVKNVPPFSAVQPTFVPTRGAFVLKQSIAVVGCYHLHNLAVHALFSLDMRILAPTHVPSVAEALDLTPAHLQTRLLSTVFYWTIQYAMLQLFYSLSGSVRALANPESIKLWPPFFGTPADAYTLRNFWGYHWHHRREYGYEFSALTHIRKSWHQALRAWLESISDHVAHKILRLQHKGPLQRYSKIFISFALSGVMHVVADMGCGLSPHQSGAMPFFLMQALGIMAEDGVQAVWRRLTVRFSFGEGVARFERIVGYAWVALYLVWTSPVWVYPACLPMRKKDALLAFGAVKPLFLGRGETVRY
ncbi:hypothetical protein LTR85_001906 [Meristemomyces frigidus]|nr:hypothetical protein LTR85_001906 [Meristemomyces frigidus]